MTLNKKYSSVPEDLHYMFATEFICNRATEGKFKNYGDIAQLWGYSSVGRASGSQSLGRRFDPDYLHQQNKTGVIPVFLF